MKTTLNWFGCVLLALALAGGGCSGDEGKDGKPGADGANGDAGVPGAKGAEGAKGADGAKGAVGMNGADGMDGADGADGDAGTDGDDGAMGAMGTMGVPGTSGIIDRTKLTRNFVVYPMAALAASNITGFVRFAEFVDGTTLVTIRITGNTNNVPDSIRTAHIHNGNVAAAGSSAVTLNNVDGFTADGTGISETLVTNLDLVAGTPGGGAAITYTQLTGLNAGKTAYVQANGFNGSVNVHRAPGDSGSATGTQPVVAAEIGFNAAPSDAVP